MDQPDQPERPLRADAARNRARVLEAALEAFAAEGLSVPIDEIARRAGVGAGTVYRHFPAKEDLVGAVIADQMQRIIDGGYALLDEGKPGEALFTFLRAAVEWSATNRGLVDTLGDSEIKVKEEGKFLDLLGELLRVAQEAGTVRKDVGVADVKALMVGLQAMQSYNDDAAERLTEVVLDGLRVP
ncbi:MAG TPA: TetR/AcrR family transcriptional regulator [Mycobacterium sp.]|nr:TetR/AcrR family transcriptional regulator [Mycobacterium sp.]